MADGGTSPAAAAADALRATQAERPLRLTTALGPDVLLLNGFAGEEAVSRPFRFTLECSAQGLVPPDPGALLGTPACVTIALPSGGERVIHGLVSRFRRKSSGVVVDGYQAELVPWLAMLALSSDCRIYQHVNVPDLVVGLCKELGFSDVRPDLLRTYAPREYCVQYQETHLAFVSRLLEEEGIFYYFEHHADRHVLVLADAPSTPPACPGVGTLRPAAGPNAWAQGHDAYTRLTVERAVHSTRVALADYNYEQPSTSLDVALPSATSPRELFEYPGRYAQVQEGNDYVRVRLEEAEGAHETASAETTAAQLTAGHVVELDGSGGGDERWFLLAVGHSAHQGAYAAGDDEAFTYENHIKAVRAGRPWRPPRVTRRPPVPGTQSALVVGKAGEEIFTDGEGRVKLHFYWDRRSKRDENSSCWVRCASAWAGTGWGQQSLPRVGQEVLVDFIDGDPDRPVVVGRVYNAERKTPYAVPTQSGVKSRSSKGGTDQHYNEIRFEDAKDHEELVIHAERLLKTTVEASETHSVGGGQTVTVGGDRRVTVGGEKDGVRTGDVKEKVFRHANRHVLGDAREKTEGKTSRTAVGDAFEVYQAAHKTETTGEDYLKAATVLIEGTGTVAVKGPTVIVDAGTTLSLRVGGNHVVIDASGVTIQGTMVRINSAGPPGLSAPASTTSGAADAPEDP